MSIGELEMGFTDAEYVNNFSLFYISYVDTRYY
jgi:hypothetical protein